MECRVAVTQADQIAILHQRYDVFVEEFHYLTPKEDNKQLEYDSYDERSLLFGVWEDEELIASCRLIFADNLFDLPTCNSLIIDSEQLQKERPTAEISRILIAHDHRVLNQTLKILHTLQEEINKVASQHSIEQLIGVVEPSFLHLLNYAHLPYIPIGPLQHHIGPDRYPVMLKLDNDIVAPKESV